MISYSLRTLPSGFSYYTFEGSKEDLIKFYKAWQDLLRPNWEQGEFGQNALKEIEAYIDKHGNMRIGRLPYNAESLDDAIADMCAVASSEGLIPCMAEYKDKNIAYTLPEDLAKTEHIVQFEWKGSSKRPSEPANPHWPGYEWVESEKACPQCGHLVWQAPWFDDPEDVGGACIGTQYECGDCGWDDTGP